MNNERFHFRIISTYICIKSAFIYKEAAILCHQIYTVALNVDLFRVS